MIANIAGYYTASAQSAYVPMAPSRMLDTRYGTGVAQGKIQANSSVTLNVANGKKIPADATAVAMNLTALGSTKNGLITAYPTGKSAPAVPTLNYTAGSTTNNMAIVPIGTGGDVTFTNTSQGPVDLLGDVTGYYTKDAVTVPNLAIVSTGTVADSRWAKQLQTNMLDSGIYLGGHGAADVILDLFGLYAE